MPHALSMIPTLIPDPAFVKRKVFLAWDAGDERRALLANYGQILLKTVWLL